MKYDTQAFQKKNLQMILIYLNKQSVYYVKHNDFNDTKLKIYFYS
jgi:hypothetical protein